MYAGGGEFTENIDDVGGVGTAEFARTAPVHLLGPFLSFVRIQQIIA